MSRRSALAGRRGMTSRQRKQALAGMLFVLPGFLLYALVMLYPAFQTVILSLQDWQVNPNKPSPWVGLDNYREAFADPIFLNSLVNAAVYTVATVPAQIVIGLFLAVLLDAKLPGRTGFRVLFYLPVITSWVIVSLLFRYIFSSDDSLANAIVVDLLGLAPENVSWFQNRWTAMIAISMLGIWKGIGWAMLIFLAALTGVPQELKEAASLDGAGAVKKFWHVSVPAIRSALAVVGILLFIGGFNVFISVQLMTGGGPGNSTQVPLTYMYQEAFEFLNFSYGASVSFILTALVLAAAGFQYWWTRRKMEA
jgi:multiple sugar transport system permease protein